MPEAQALDTILRSAAGYVMAPRMAGAPGASVYDRILILATSRPPAATAPAARRSATRPMPQAPSRLLNDLPDDDRDPPIGPNPVAMPGLNAPGDRVSRSGQMLPQPDACAAADAAAGPRDSIPARNHRGAARPDADPAPTGAPYFNPTLPGAVPPAPTATRPGGRGGGGQVGVPDRP